MPEFNIDEKVDTILDGKPEAQRLVRANREFIKSIKDKKISKEQENVQVFGVKSVNVNAILKDNIWNRSIFTTDKLCRLFLGMTLEQLKKYEKKKRTVPLNMLWIVLIMIVGIAVVLVILFLLPQLGVQI